MESDPQERRFAAPSPVPSMQRWDALFSIVAGMFLILMMPRIWQIMLLKNQTYSFADEMGNPLAYTRSIYFPGDLAMALFSVALIVEGGVLIVRRTRPLLATCLAIIVLSVLSNVCFVIYMLQKGYGFQMMSGFAAAFGTYIGTYQWSLLKQMPRPGRISA